MTTTPQNPTLAMIAAQNAVAHLLRRGKLDPFSESHSRLCTAYAYLFNEQINDVREKFGGIELSPGEIDRIYDGLLRQDMLRAPEVTVPTFTVKEVV